jgi:acyl-CoA synthetase (AMP-forming)/AMP-acid ligase II
MFDNSSLDEKTQFNITAARTLPGHPPTDYLVPYRNVGQLLAMRAQETPDKLFLIHYDQAGHREEWSYAQFNRRVNQLASFMAADTGYRPGRPHRYRCL